MTKPLCKGYLAALQAADAHTREALAILDAELVDDLMIGKIDHAEFLLCATVDASVNNC